jgi:LysR family transcriptional regulator for metE and metH
MLPGTSLETRDLRLVFAIAEAGSATRAARLLHISQSAVSHQLRALESRLGRAVFEREGRRLRFTDAGQRLLELARAVLQPIAEAELELRRSAIKKRPTLRLAVQCNSAYHWLPAALAALTSRHPEVDLSMASENLDDELTALEADRVDLALCVSRIRGAHLERRKLFEDELVLVLPRGHRLARKKFVSGEDLVDETLIVNETVASERARVLGKLFRNGSSFARVLRLPMTDAILELVQAGFGVSIQPGFAIRHRLERGEVASVRLTRHGLVRTWTGFYRRRSSLARPIETLLEVVRGQALAVFGSPGAQALRRDIPSR